MPTVIAVANQKGGVGKTTTTANLGAALARHGRRVLLVDMDPQGNLTSAVGVSKAAEQTVADALLDFRAPLPTIKIENGTGQLDLAPATLALASAEAALMNKLGREQRLRDQINRQGAAYDFVVIDTPPSLGLLLQNALHPSPRPAGARVYEELHGLDSGIHLDTSLCGERGCCKLTAATEVAQLCHYHAKASCPLRSATQSGRLTPSHVTASIRGAPGGWHYTNRVPSIGKVLSVLPGKAIELPEPHTPNYQRANRCSTQGVPYAQQGLYQKVLRVPMAINCQRKRHRLYNNTVAHAEERSSAVAEAVRFPRPKGRFL